MKNYAMFYFDYLFGDHFEKVSAKAKLLYVNLNFYANAGFVANPKKICKEMGFNETTIDELIKNGELLSIEGRDEMFITSYFVHNPNFQPLHWTKTPYATYWFGKLWMKKNRVATLKQPKENEEKPQNVDEKKEPRHDTRPQIDPTLPDSAKDDDSFDALINVIENAKNKNK